MILGGKKFTISRIHIIQCQERHKNQPQINMSNDNILVVFCLRKTFLKPQFLPQKSILVYCVFCHLVYWGLGEQWAQSSFSSSSLKELQHHLDWHFLKKTKQFAALKEELIWNCFDLWMVPKIPRYTLVTQPPRKKIAHPSILGPGCWNHNQPI